MIVDNIKLLDKPLSPKGFETICSFGVQITPDLRLYDLQLLRAPDGRHLIVAPQHRNGAPFCSFSPTLRDELLRLTLLGVMKVYSEKTRIRGTVRAGIFPNLPTFTAS